MKQSVNETGNSPKNADKSAEQIVNATSSGARRQRAVTVIVLVVVVLLLAGAVALWGLGSNDSGQGVAGQAVSTTAASSAKTGADVNSGAKSGANGSSESNGSAEDKTGDTEKTSNKNSENTSEKDARRQQVLQILRAEARRNPNDLYALGSVDAPVVMIEYADYRCPFCGMWQRETFPRLEKYIKDGTLRYEWRDVPMIGGEQSIKIAMAARAAALQGKFWPFHEEIFSRSPSSGHRNWSPAELIEVAKDVKVPDLAKFKVDMVSAELQKQVIDEFQHAYELGLPSVPAFIINDQVITGAQPATVFMQVIEEQAAAARK